MQKKYLLKYLRLDESVVGVVHAAWWHYKRSFLVGLFLLLIAVFLFYPLVQLGKAGWVIFFSLFGFGALWLLKNLLVRYLNVTIITNQRIIKIDQRGLWEKHVAECPLAHVVEVRYFKKGLGETIFNLGNVQIELSRGTQLMEIVGVANPAGVKDLIIIARRNHNKNFSPEQVGAI